MVVVLVVIAAKTMAADDGTSNDAGIVRARS